MHVLRKKQKRSFTVKIIRSFFTIFLTFLWIYVYRYVFLLKPALKNRNFDDDISKKYALSLLDFLRPLKELTLQKCGLTMIAIGCCCYGGNQDGCLNCDLPVHACVECCCHLQVKRTKVILIAYLLKGTTKSSNIYAYLFFSWIDLVQQICQTHSRADQKPVLLWTFNVFTDFWLEQAYIDQAFLCMLS